MYPDLPETHEPATQELTPLPTYAAMRAYLHSIFPAGDRARILTTSLNAFRAYCKQQDADVMNALWRKLPDGVMNDFAVFLTRDLAIAESTAVKRLEHVRQLRRLMLTLHETSTLPSGFSEAMQAILAARSLTVRSAARGADINPSDLRRWIQGAAPTAKMHARIASLEQYLMLPAGTLLTRLPRRSRARTAGAPRTRTEFGERMAKLHALRREPGWEPLWLPYEQARPTWEPYLVWKSDRNRPEIDVPVDKYFSPYWRTKAPHEVGCKVRPCMQLPDGRIATSAAVSYGHIATYWGWLRTTQSIPASQCPHLTWLVDLQKVRAHLLWKEARSGKRHAGIRDFVVQVAALTRPGAGYLWCMPELLLDHPDPVALVGFDPRSLTREERTSRWREFCESVHAAANDLKRHQYRPRALKKVRNTSMEIKPLADLDDSLSTVVKALNAARSDARKLVPGRDQWSTYRDVLLSQMMLSNPLRPAQFAAMTYRRDNTGNIYQTSRGVWRMRFNASDFKNERGAAHEDYDVAIARSLWPHIVQYLRAVRPHLLGAETDFVFLPTDLSQRSAMRELKSGMWTGEDLSLRVGVLGTQLFPQMRSFSAYTLRHLVATAFLQRHPQQFTQLAKLLNDKLATVLRVYARETHDDAFDIQNGDIDDAMDDGENKD